MELLSAVGLAVVLLGAPAPKSDDVPREDRVAIGEFVAALKANDWSAMAKLVQYPLIRPPPLSWIETPADFVAHFDDYFDSRVIALLLKKPKGESVGWKGTMLGSGLVWFRDGKVTAFTTWTDWYSADLAQAKLVDQSQLYPAAAGYDELRLDCRTPTHHLRIEAFGEVDRYFSWKAGASLSSAPDLVLRGTWRFEGTGDYASSAFASGSDTYTLVGHGAYGDNAFDLEVRRGKELLSKETCLPSTFR